jgi:hypothetical protein
MRMAPTAVLATPYSRALPGAVTPSRMSFPLCTLRRETTLSYGALKRARVEKFHWHDLRHIVKHEQNDNGDDARYTEQPA